MARSLRTATASCCELTAQRPASTFPASLHNEFGALVAAVPDQLGSGILRVVPDDVWSFAESVAVEQGEVGERLAPRAAVALDLMDSGDPRHWVAAKNLIEARG